MSEPRTLRIDIWSDVMCPWCLVGWGSLQKGLAQLEGEIEADIRWHAFELNPDMPPEGEESTAHIARKYGSTPDQSKAVQGRMREAAQNAGVSLDYQGEDPEPPRWMWNTFDAHKLLTWAGEAHGPEKQTELKLALFEAHFNRRRQIGDHAVLLDVADSVGLDRAAAEAALASEEWAHKVRAEERAAWDFNITGVPAMIVENKFMIPGAQPPEAYADALRRVAQKTAA
ncbi:MAG: DsbA family oxidoreductase [Erythrobacter sp.]|jgi:predicted DsbA family dithiol-disulfide isomerase|uniref:DsbA family oxidoreductase n=1 Tax=Qipengyuania citrea TaxID=225971 RepID=UPI001A390CB2|nr:DsbA family oxidoreductase [Qipengyuania citrea]MBL4718048.1 DsbA family oxidoreductase [Erythrobacter sp.]MCP2015987.1 putative DsbA family dithiol-disulfide isomerase [Qipengyuania citrea]MDE0902892.1 DsbA family oxidoreductase [Erythrobacter sp.]|tara:strand:+ start:1766 stop:2449 length:684 start_codon:yes stop_codon:yes gene_type:complete